MQKQTGKEIKVSDQKHIESRTDSLGVIEYVNDYFLEISGYSEAELIGRPHNVVRHPDMPKVLFKMIWKRINKGENIRAIIKNLAKDGRYYWVITEFEPKIDPVTNIIISHTAFKRHVSQKTISTITPIYQKLLEIEEKHNMQASEDYLLEYLEKNNTTYDELIDKLIADKGIFQRLLQL